MAATERTPYLDLAAGLPRYGRSVRRRLRQGSDLIAAKHGYRAARITVCRGGLAGLRGEITAAWQARNDQAGRAADRAAWAALYGRAEVAVTLRIGGRVAAWALARPGAPGALDVLAGQMHPDFRDYNPGRLAEAALIGWALAEGFDRIEWGPGHPEALIAVTR